MALTRYSSLTRRSAAKDRHASTDTPSDRSVDGYVLDYIVTRTPLFTGNALRTVDFPDVSGMEIGEGREIEIHHRGQRLESAEIDKASDKPSTDFT